MTEYSITGGKILHSGFHNTALQSSLYCTVDFIIPHNGLHNTAQLEWWNCPGTTDGRNTDSFEDYQYSLPVQEVICLILIDYVLVLEGLFKQLEHFGI